MIKGIVETSTILARANLRLAGRYYCRRIVILFDCQASLKALVWNEINSKLVRKGVNAISKLASRNSEHLGWLPGNESADDLAESQMMSESWPSG